VKISIALWVPTIWAAILASRPASNWMSGNAPELSAVVEDGNSLDRVILSVLMAAAAITLFRRKVNWIRLFRENLWIVIFFLYCFVSVLWSDFPGVAFKRLIRAMGALMMVVVVLSEEDPVAAVVALVRRCVYVLVPLSFLLIKYYRNIGVWYDYWTGELVIVGVGINKNSLGRLCLIAGVFGFWDFITAWRDDRVDRLNRFVILAMTVVSVQLLVQSHSATSLAAFVVGIAIIVTLGVPLLRKNVRHLGTVVVVVSLIGVLIGMSTLIEATVTSLGRDMTFTTRTAIWDDLLALHTNPVVGVGYDSFWLGDRLNDFVRKYQINEAHNGYLEVYLELGVIGLVLLASLALKAFFDAKRLMLRKRTFDYGRLRMAVIAIFILYNVTEAAYKVTALMFFLLLLVVATPPRDLELEPLATAPPLHPRDFVRSPPAWRSANAIRAARR
jgi:exopolysaccharide production protein ExoQ